jgi:hypothetical protein
MNGLYVFALAGDRCEPFERAGHVIEIIATGGVYAAVERVDRPPTVSEQALRDQHEVIAHLHAKLDALLPARFGAFLDARELESVAGQRRNAILEALQLVRGRSQMTIRLLGGEAAQPAAPALAGSRAVSGTDYLESRRALLSALPSALSAASEAVRSLAVAERFETGRGSTAATLYHLVEKRQVQAYRDLLAPVASGDGKLTVTGPWAPFAFTPDVWT